MTVEEQIIICAVRYALGRMSYVVSVVCGYVAGKHRELSPECIAIIVRDIEEAVELSHKMGRMCGMEGDERAWLRLLKLLKTRVE